MAPSTPALQVPRLSSFQLTVQEGGQKHFRWPVPWEGLTSVTAALTRVITFLVGGALIASNCLVSSLPGKMFSWI